MVLPWHGRVAETGDVTASPAVTCLLSTTLSYLGHLPYSIPVFLSLQGALLLSLPLILAIL